MRFMLQKCLNGASSSYPLLLLLDTQGEWEGESSSFQWLPLPLPPHVKVLVTCETGSELESTLAEVAATHGGVKIQVGEARGAGNAE